MSKRDIHTAQAIARVAHRSQTYNGRPYYEGHVRRVAAKAVVVARQHGALDMVRDAFIVGLLHDVVEDTDITLDHLKTHGFSYDVIEAVRLLTHEVGDGLTYLQYVKRIGTNKLATLVKLADLWVNYHTPGRPNKKPTYRAAYAYLTGELLCGESLQLP